MAFDWKEFLGLARALANRTGSGYSVEAAGRTAVSRAYYAAYCWARNYAMSQLGFQPTGKPKDHKRLREHLKYHGKPQVASQLNMLRRWRIDCDYHDQVHNINTMVKSALEIADKVIQECK